jgi:plastocyanin
VVQWTWAANGHNVISGDPATGTPDNVFCSPNDTGCAAPPPLLPSGTTYTHTFTTPGTFTYYCRAHRGSGMVGTIIVNPAE